MTIMVEMETISYEGLKRATKWRQFGCVGKDKKSWNPQAKMREQGSRTIGFIL